MSVVDFSQTLTIYRHNGLLGYSFDHYDYSISQEDLADGTKTSVISGTFLDIAEICKVIMDFSDTYPHAKSHIAAFCMHDFDTHQYFEIHDEF